MYFKSQLALIATSTLIFSVKLVHAESHEDATYQIHTSVSLVSDVRVRGISDSLLKPGIKLGMLAVHETGLVGMAEVVNVSEKKFLDGNGLGLTLGAGYRFGNPEAWHFGVGAAALLYPGAKFTAPHGFDMAVGPIDFRETSFDTNFLLLEIGYGALKGRILNVISDTSRGINTGSVCSSMLYYNLPEITEAAECYARGDKGSSGTLLYDLDYTFYLSPATKLKLHAGYQDVANFPEADVTDYGIGITHMKWGFEWSLDYVTTYDKMHELYLIPDGEKLREINGDKLVLSVTRYF